MGQTMQSTAFALNAGDSLTDIFDEKSKVNPYANHVIDNILMQRAASYQSSAAFKSPEDELAYRTLIVETNTYLEYLKNANTYKNEHPNYTVELLRTQKAKALYNLTHSAKSFAGVDLLNVGFTGSRHDLFVVMPYVLPEPQVFYDNQMFARPCPITPRHGFVESRTVSSYVELLQVWRETLDADPMGEMIVMEKLEGQFSGVATNAGVSWGFGNDGVTNGGQSVLIPAYIDPDTFKTQAMHKFHHKSVVDRYVPNSLYVELVQGKRAYANPEQDTVYAVQFRDGPPTPGSVNFIPREEKIKKVLVPNAEAASSNALLDWERQIAEELAKNGGPEGLVVYTEGALSSHWAVHAIQNDIAVVTDRYPVKGETLKPTDNRVQKLKHRDVKTIAKYLKRWHRRDYLRGFESPGILGTAVATIHAMPLWDNRDKLLEFRGMAVDALFRYLASACIGEVRHYRSRGPGQGMLARRKKSRTEERVKLSHGLSTEDNGRSQIYHKFLASRTDFVEIVEVLKLAVEDFNDDGWDGSYGGRKWGQVSQKTAELGEAIATFLWDTSVSNWNKVAQAANIALHMYHNNGSATSKWLEGSYLTRIASAPALGFCNLHAARTALGLKPDLKQYKGSGWSLRDER